jgi:zinc protease
MAATAPVQKRVLYNGLTILLREDHSAPVVTAQMWVRAGSITEGPWLGAGLSHVLEHMLFKSTTTRGVAGIAQEVEDKGGFINAYTSFEQTVYYINMPAENWQTAVDILADCMMHATIPADELAKEKEVILREMAMGQDDPGRRANRLLWATAYTTHPYRHPVIGYPDIYNRATHADVVAYYKKFYVPNNITFVVVGDINAAQAEARIRELTKDFKMGAIEPPFVPAEPRQLSTRTRFEEMAVQLSRLALSWHIPAMSHPDVYALDVLAIIAGQGRSSRLYRELRQNRSLVHSISAGCYTPAYPGLFSVEALVDADKRDATIAAARTEMARFNQEPVAEAELRKAIKQTISSHLDRLKTMEGQAADLASNDILTGDPNFSATYLANIEQVTAADIQRVANRYFTDANLTVTSLDPTGTAGQQAPAAVVTTGIPVQKFVLANGLRVLVREDPKIPTVDVRVVLKGGVFAETAADNGVTKLTSRMLLKGTAMRTADQIAETIESVGGSIGTFSGNNSFGVSAHALSEDLPLALDLVADVLLHPSFPEEQLTRERNVQLAEIKAEQDQILPAAQQLLRETLYAKHPYRLNVNGQAATVAKLQRDNLVTLQRRLVVPANMVLVVFGDVKATDVRRLVEERLGALKPGKAEFPKTAPESLAADARKQTTKPKEQAVLLVGFPTTDMFSPDRFALDLINEAYSGMGARLFLRIRDELGLAYYVGAYQLPGLQTGFLAFYIGTTAKQVATCEKELFADLEMLGKDGLNTEDLERAKNSIIGQRRVRMQDNAELGLMVGLDELYGLGYDYYRQMDERYRAVTTAEVQRVAKKYFAGKPHAVVVVRPEKE